MKTKLNKCWKLIGGGTALLVASSFSSSLTFLHNNLDQKNTYRISNTRNSLDSGDLSQKNDTAFNAKAYQIFRDETEYSVPGNITFSMSGTTLILITATAAADWNDLTVKGSGTITDDDGNTYTYQNIQLGVGDGQTPVFYNSRDYVAGNWTFEGGVSLQDNQMLKGSGCFEDCTRLTSVTFEEGIKILGIATFFGCTGLTSVNLPVSLTEIHQLSFRDCTFESLKIPANVTTIEDYAFYNVTNLKAITLGTTNPATTSSWLGLPSSIQHIYVPKDYVDNFKTLLPTYEWFKNGGFDASIIEAIPDPTPTYANADKFFTSTSGDTVTGTVCYLDNGNGTITLLPDNSTESSEATVTTSVIGKNLQLDTTSDGKIGMPVTAINDESFSQSQITGTLDLSNCTALTSIGMSAFANEGTSSSNDITSVNLPGNITTFGDMIFGNNDLTDIECTANENYEVFQPNKNENGKILVEKGTSTWTNETKTLGGIACGNIDLQSYSFTSLNAYSFIGAPITSIQLPNGLTEIAGEEPSPSNAEGIGALMSCTKLRSVKLPTSLKTIGCNAFTGCLSLPEINTSDLVNLNTIKDEAFNDCINLTDFIIPKNVKTIGAYVFAMTDEMGSSKLTQISFENTNPNWISGLDNDWLGGDEYRSVKTINVPEGCKNKYVQAYNSLYSAGTYDWFKTGMSWEEYTPPQPTDSNLDLGIALGVSLGICVGIPGIIGLGFLIDYKNKEKKQNKQE